MLTIQYILARYPALRAFGWYPLITVPAAPTLSGATAGQQQGVGPLTIADSVIYKDLQLSVNSAQSEIWDIKMFIARLPYGLTMIVIYNTHLDPNGRNRFVFSRFLYHRATGVAIGRPQIIGQWLEGWHTEAGWEHISTVCPLLRPAEFVNTLFTYVSPTGATYETDPTCEQFASWHTNLVTAITLRVWRRTLETTITHVIAMQRRRRALVASRRNLVKPTLSGPAPAIRILLEMHECGRITRERLADLMRAYITTCVINPDKSVATDRLRMLEPLFAMNELEKAKSITPITKHHKKQHTNPQLLTVC